jgi:hypothetical protein
MSGIPTQMAAVENDESRTGQERTLSCGAAARPGADSRRTRSTHAMDSFLHQ